MSLAHAIRAASSRHRVFLVSASKSGPEVALALGRELAAQETESVVGWLSLVGAVRGSLLADRVLEPDLCWFVESMLRAEGFDMDGLVSMRASELRPAFAELRFPAHVRVVSLIAAPLSGGISSRGASGYAHARARTERRSDALVG